MAAWNSIEGVVTGRVRSVNEKGLKLDGHDSWLNVSRYAVGVVLPERGDAVACTLDKARRIAPSRGSPCSRPRPNSPPRAI
jgi:hypothetical protein